jgi:HlyD family secretion protein
MHRPNPKRIAPIIILLAVVLGGYYLYSTGRLTLGAALAANANTASGYIEGEEVSIASEVGGRIELLAVNEGDPVKAGQELVRIERTVLDAQIAQAQAALDTANAQLAQVKAGPRTEDVRQAEAALAQAMVMRDGTKRTLDSAQVVHDNPQELNARIAAAQSQLDTQKSQVEVAKHSIQMAQANADAAAVRKDAFGGPAGASVEARIAVNQWWAAEEALLAARASLDVAQTAVAGAQRGLDVLLEIKANPVTANAQLDTAKLQYDSAASAVDVAQARLDAVKVGASKEQVAVTEAQVKQAAAALNVLQVQTAKMSVKSPATGIVTRRTLHQGEVTAPGASLLTVASLDPVKLTIYVPETQIGQIKIGDSIDVQVDSFPGRTFKGSVTFIASQGEFTPRNVQTKTERVNIVFAVRVQIPNANLDLKPGMPADATLK